MYNCTVKELSGIFFNPYCTGGGPGGPPLDIFGDCAATAWNFELSFHDFFPSSLTHILIPFSSKSDIPVRRYITISMRMSSKKKKKLQIASKFA